MSAKDTKMIPPDDSGGGEGVLGCGLEVGVEVGGGCQVDRGGMEKVASSPDSAIDLTEDAKVEAETKAEDLVSELLDELLGEVTQMRRRRKKKRARFTDSEKWGLMKVMAMARSKVVMQKYKLDLICRIAAWLGGSESLRETATTGTAGVSTLSLQQVTIRLFLASSIYGGDQQTTCFQNEMVWPFILRPRGFNTIFYQPNWVNLHRAMFNDGEHFSKNPSILKCFLGISMFCLEFRL